MTEFKVGQRVRFARSHLQEAGVGQTEILWRICGTVVGHQPPRYTRVLFDSEKNPRTIPTVNLERVPS